MIWREIAFGDFAEVQPQVKLEKGTAYSFIEMSNVEPHTKSVDPRSTRIWKGSGGAKFENGDVIFARITPCLEHGKAAKVDNLTDSRGFGSTEFFVFRGQEGISDPDYIYYLARSPVIREPAIKSMIGASGRQRAQKIVLENTIIRAPEIQEQRRIASILSAYDDLIENNRRRIQLLEQAARLLYREWFVHLRFPGHEHVSIIDGVPEGWEKTTIGSVSSFISRGITPKYNEEAPGIVLNQKCIRNQRVEMELARYQSKEVMPNKLVRYGDVLINSTGQGTLGRVAQFFGSIENCTVDSHVTIARPHEGLPVQLYGHHIASMEDFLAIMGRGATNQTELSKDTVSEIPFFRLPHMLGEQFEAFAKETSGQIQNIMQQNTMLAKARDLLLPRLMNGDVAV